LVVLSLLRAAGVGISGMAARVVGICRKTLQKIGELVGVLLLDGKDALEQAARGRVAAVEEADRVPVAVDRD
jgi:hypothetical protein